MWRNRPKNCRQQALKKCSAVWGGPVRNEVCDEHKPGVTSATVVISAKTECVSTSCGRQVDGKTNNLTSSDLKNFLQSDSKTEELKKILLFFDFPGHGRIFA